jgi:hypothetical protein
MARQKPMVRSIMATAMAHRGPGGRAPVTISVLMWRPSAASTLPEITVAQMMK